MVGAHRAAMQEVGSFRFRDLRKGTVRIIQAKKKRRRNSASSWNWPVSMSQETTL